MMTDNRSSALWLHTNTTAGGTGLEQHAVTTAHGFTEVNGADLQYHIHTVDRGGAVSESKQTFFPNPVQ